MVQPISRLIVGKVAFMAHDRCQAKEEDETVKLQRLDRDATCPLTLPRFDIENAEPKHPSHGAVCHQKRKIATRKKEVNCQRCCKETTPDVNILIQSVQREALLAGLFLGLVRCRALRRREMGMRKVEYKNGGT